MACVAMTFLTLYDQAVCTAQLRAPDAGTALRLLLMAPLLEEWVMRAGVQEYLATRGPRWPAWPPLASTLAFSLLHLGAGWQAALAVTVPGLALALLYQAARDWRICAAMHAAFNGMALLCCIR
jgi:membrane protease YdiL (CAAX protease family)